MDVLLTKAVPCSGDSGGAMAQLDLIMKLTIDILGQHAKTAASLCEITTRNVCRGLVANTELNERSDEIQGHKKVAQTLKPVGHQSTN